MNLIKSIARYFGYELVKIKPEFTVKPFTVKKEIEKLFTALKESGFVFQGINHTDFSRIHIFHTQDKSVLIELSENTRYSGELIGVYAQINEVNIDSLILKLTAKNESLQNAREALNEALKIVIANKSDKTEIPSPLDNALRKAGNCLNNLE